MVKICTVCKIEYPTTLEFFHKDGRALSGLCSRCKKCHSKSHKIYYTNNKEKIKTQRKKYYKENMETLKKRQKLWRQQNVTYRQNSQFKTHYNFTLEEYIKLLEIQKGLCSICKQIETAKHQSGTLRALSVDHNHKTKKIRGLLCNNCNRGLGYFKDDISVLEEAIKYLNDK